MVSDRTRYAEGGRRYRQLVPAARVAEEWRCDEAGLWAGDLYQMLTCERFAQEQRLDARSAGERVGVV